MRRKTEALESERVIWQRKFDAEKEAAMTKLYQQVRTHTSTIVDAHCMLVVHWICPCPAHQNSEIFWQEMDVVERMRGVQSREAESARKAMSLEQTEHALRDRLHQVIKYTFIKCSDSVWPSVDLFCLSSNVALLLALQGIHIVDASREEA